MADILKGNVVANKIKEQMAKDIENLKGENKVPKLAIVRLGQNPGKYMDKFNAYYAAN